MFQAQDNKEINRLHLRIKFLSFCFFLGFLVLSAKILYLANLSLGSVISITESDIHNMKRPNIYDRNGHLVASNIAISSVAIRPNLLRNKEDIVDRLLSAVPSFQREDLEYKIFNDKKFVWLKRGITPSEQDRIHNLGIPGIQFIDETKRFYSSANTLSSVIGYVNIDNIGQAGVEKFIDQQLETGNSGDVYLSADLEVSHAMRDELLKSMNEYSSIAAAGVLMDINNGEIIAAVSLPDFDPQYQADALLPENINKVTNSLYEIGSTFKPFTIAMALDSGLVHLDTEYDARQPIIAGGHKISDFRPQARILTVSEIFTHSSNIGAAKIALDFGTDYHKSFLKKLGLLDPVSTQIQNLPSSSIPVDWKEINTITISYGHGIAVSPLHAAVAGAPLFNGGRLVQPSFIKVENDSNTIYKQVLEPSTSEKIKKLMYMNVVDGSATRASVDGIFVGGKTGTANKLVGGSYDKDTRRTTFMGAFPLDKPKYIMFLLLDEPKPTENSHGLATAGWNVAPTFSNIVRRIAPMLDIKPSSIERLYDYDQIVVASN